MACRQYNWAHIRLINLRRYIILYICCKGGFNNTTTIYALAAYTHTTHNDWRCRYSLCKFSTLYISQSIFSANMIGLLWVTRADIQKLTQFIYRAARYDGPLWFISEYDSRTILWIIANGPGLLCIQYDVRDWLDFGLANVNNGITQCSFWQIDQPSVRTDRKIICQANKYLYAQ